MMQCNQPEVGQSSPRRTKLPTQAATTSVLFFAGETPLAHTVAWLLSWSWLDEWMNEWRKDCFFFKGTNIIHSFIHSLECYTNIVGENGPGRLTVGDIPSKIQQHYRYLWSGMNQIKTKNLLLEPNLFTLLPGGGWQRAHGSIHRRHDKLTNWQASWFVMRGRASFGSSCCRTCSQVYCLLDAFLADWIGCI